MGGDLCGGVEKKRRREGDGWRVRESTEDEHKARKRGFGGAFALWRRAEQTRRRKHALAANGSCRQSSIGEQGCIRRARDTAICFEQAQYQGARERGNLRGEAPRLYATTVLSSAVACTSVPATSSATTNSTLRLPVSWCVCRARLRSAISAPVPDRNRPISMARWHLSALLPQHHQGRAESMTRR
jgi:hypothetical protein